MWTYNYHNNVRSTEFDNYIHVGLTHARSPCYEDIKNDNGIQGHCN